MSTILTLTNAMTFNYTRARGMQAIEYLQQTQKRFGENPMLSQSIQCYRQRMERE